MMTSFRLITVFSLLTATTGEKAPSFRQRERTLHSINPAPQMVANDYGFNGFAAAQQQAALQTPWWNSDELLPNVFPWLPSQRLAENPAPAVMAPLLPPNGKPSTDLINFLNGPDGKDGPMKHIMRVLRILPPKDPVAGILPNGQPVPVGFIPSSPPTRPPSVDQICPSGVEPLFKQGRYTVCNPRNATGCPLGYICDRSALLSEHICCKDRYGQQQSLWTATSEKVTTPATDVSSSQTSSSSSTSASPNSSLNTTDGISSSSTTTKSIWAVWSEWTASQTPSTTISTTIQPSPATFTPSIESGLLSNETINSTTKPWPPLPGNPFVHFPKYPSPNQFPNVAAIGKRIWQPIDPLETNKTQATRPPWEIIAPPEQPPSVGVEPGMSSLSTPFPMVTIELNGVEVLPLTVGNVMSLPNGDFEWASTITLIRDGDKTILVDTGVPADTNILIRELSKHGLRPENIDTVVITHGHPDHFGNQNLFSRKRQLFSSFEFIGNRFSRTALVDQQFRKLYPHVEVWKTPGHTPEDLTVIVRDVPTLGTVAIVGDLILNEDFLLNPEQWTNTGSWDRHIQQNNINMIVCMVDCVVPGHGGMFRLHDEHRKYSNCAQRYPVYYANYYG